MTKEKTLAMLSFLDLIQRYHVELNHHQSRGGVSNVKYQQRQQNCCPTLAHPGELGKLLSLESL